MRNFIFVSFFCFSFSLFADYTVTYTFSDIPDHQTQEISGSSIASVPLSFNFVASNLQGNTGDAILYFGSTGIANYPTGENYISINDSSVVGVTLSVRNNSWYPISGTITIVYSGDDPNSGSGGSGDPGSGGSGGSGSGSGTATGSGTLQNGNLSFSMSGPWALESTLQGSNTLLDDISTSMNALEFNTATTASNTGNIATLSGIIASNTATTASNTGTIASNTGTIVTNTGSIASNTGTIVTNTGSIASNTGSIASNTASIASNMGTIVTNTGSIVSNTGTIATNTTSIKNDVASMKTDLSALKDVITQSNTSPSPPQRIETLPVPSSVPALTTIKNKLFPPSLFSSSSKQRFNLVINMPAPAGGFYHLSMDFPMSSTSVETQNGTLTFPSEMVAAINGFFSLFRTGLLILLVWCFVKVVIKTLRQW